MVLEWVSDMRAGVTAIGATETPMLTVVAAR